MHHGFQHVGRKLGAGVNDVAREAALVDLGGVDIDDGHVLGVLLTVGIDGERRGENNMSQDAAIPDPRQVLAEGGESFHLLNRSHISEKAWSRAW